MPKSSVMPSHRRRKKSREKQRRMRSKSQKKGAKRLLDALVCETPRTREKFRLAGTMTWQYYKYDVANSLTKSSC